MQRSICLSLQCLSLLVVGMSPSLLAADTDTMSSEGKAPLNWHTDYGQAVREATELGQMVFICFHKEGDQSPVDNINALAAKDDTIRSQLLELVLLAAELDATTTYEGESSRLLDYSAFDDLRNRPGLAMIDYRDAESVYFGRVVTVYPVTSQRRVDDESLPAILGLPEGTLTQRSLVLAVRMHHERPKSVEADWHPTLATETELHSNHQANIRVQGHHNWERRFHRINRRLGNGMLAQEVCAESWPGQGLMDAAEECVSSWRQSSGHWRAVSGRQRLFAYDMKRGSNGIWYATGIFAR